MAINQETRISKNDTFEDWRQKDNEISKLTKRLDQAIIYKKLYFKMINKKTRDIGVMT